MTIAGGRHCTRHSGRLETDTRAWAIGFQRCNRLSGVSVQYSDCRTRTKTTSRGAGTALTGLTGLPPSVHSNPHSSVLCPRLPSALRTPPVILRPPSSILRPSSRLRPPSSVCRPPSSILTPQPSICASSALCSPPSVFCSPSPVLRRSHPGAGQRCIVAEGGRKGGRDG